MAEQNNVQTEEQVNAQKTNDIINKVMQASFGETSNVMTVSFKKTVLVRDYETEVIEASTNVVIDKAITGAERTFITAIMRIQMEYEAFCNLVMKGMVTQTQFNQRKECLANELSAIKAKSESVLGRSLDEYLTLNTK